MSSVLESQIRLDRLLLEKWIKIGYWEQGFIVILSFAVLFLYVDIKVS